MSQGVLAYAPTNRDIDNFADAWLAELYSNDEAAAKKFLSLLDSEPDNLSLAERLWNSAIRAGDREKAVRAARVIMAQGGNSEAVMLLFGNALQRRDWNEAQECLNALDAGNNYAFSKSLLEAWLRNARKQPANFSVSSENALLQFYSADQPAYLALAAGQMVRAKAALSLLSALESDYIVDLKIRATPVLVANGESEFAQELLGSAVPSDIKEQLTKPGRANSLPSLPKEQGLASFYGRLAQALIDQGAPEKALAMARISLWLMPEDSSSKLIVAAALEANGLGTAASGMRQGIAESSPYWARAITDEISSLSKAGDARQAAQLAAVALQKRNSAEFGVLLGQMQEDSGELASARETYAKLAKGALEAGVSPQRQAVYYLYLATVDDKLGNWSDARRLLEDAQKLDPQNAYVANYYGYSLLERGERLNDALEMLRRAHRLAPESMAITDSLGWAYFQTGDYENAVSFLEKAARSAGSDVTINEHLGDAYWMAGRLIDARYAWRIAILGANDEERARITKKIERGLEQTGIRAD